MKYEVEINLLRGLEKVCRVREHLNDALRSLVIPDREVTFYKDLNYLTNECLNDLSEAYKHLEK